MGEYIVYGKPNCDYCVKAKSALKLASKGATYVDVSINTEAKQFIKDLGHTTVPQIFKGEEYIGGHDELVIHLRVEEYENSPASDICSYANANLIVDSKPDNFQSLTLGKAIDVAHLINPDAIYASEGNSDDWFIYVDKNIPLLKGGS